jgi:hypothetical protein
MPRVLRPDTCRKSRKSTEVHSALEIIAGFDESYVLCYSLQAPAADSGEVEKIALRGGPCAVS